MKKTTKTMLALMAGALAFTACSNDDAIVNESTTDKLSTLTAVMEDADAETRAVIDGLDIIWNASTNADKISVFGTSNGDATEYTLSAGFETTSGTFTGAAVTGANYALYPSQSDAIINSDGIIANVPITQKAVLNGADPDAMLMVGAIDANNKVAFKNVMSYIKVTIPSGMSCKQVVVKAKDEWLTLAGKVAITVADNPTWAETSPKKGQAFVRLVPSSGTTIAAGIYYVAVLPQTMSSGFEVIYNVNDVIYYKQTTSTSDAQKKFVRRKVKNIGTLSTADSYYTFKVGTVTAGTITMADRNIGVGGTGTTVPTGSDAYGDYFAWGALRPAYTKKPTSGTTLTDLYWPDGYTIYLSPYYSFSAYTKYNNTDGKTVLESTDDIASMLWGGKWRMATYNELNNNSSQSSVSSLPLAGCCGGTTLSSDGTSGVYWSSTLYGDDAVYLGTNGSIVNFTPGYRQYGYSVRPVLAE